MTEVETTLEELRRKIDGIDDAIHDLLMKRTALAEDVRTAKTPVESGSYRPAREAEILRRLVARHGGSFPKPVLVRIWREITAAMLHLQGPFSVAVLVPEGRHWYWDHAREHFGASVPMTGYQNVRSVVAAVGDGTVAVGVLPLPEEDETAPWWPSLATNQTTRTRIVARIPFAGGGSGHGDTAGALVIGDMAQEPTGSDRSFLSFRASNEVSRARLAEVLTEAGLPPLYMLPYPDDEDPDLTQYLAEISEFVAEEDARIIDLVEDEDPLPRMIRVLGGYALPFSAADLETEAGDAQGARP